MKKIISIIAAVVILSDITSCRKYLDVVPDDIATLESAFANANETTAYLFGCYSTLQSLADIRGNAGFTGSAEIMYPFPLSDENMLGGAGGNAGFRIMRGLQNRLSPIQNFWDGENQGKNMWQAIRRCNIFLENVNKPLDLPGFKKVRMIAEAKFLKAYYHYWLLRMYGPIPIMDVTMPIDASTEQVRVSRQPVDSVFSYVTKLIDEASVDLPSVIQESASEAGRITSVIALCVKAEVLATQASPLFNGNPDVTSLKNKNGTALFSSAYDASKWEKALTACEVAVDAADKAGISLYQFRTPGNIVHLSDSTRELLALQGTVTDSWNTEQIWTLNPYFGFQNMCTPVVSADAATQLFGISSHFAVPLAMSELFYTSNGVPINEDKTWDYQGRYKIQYGDSAHMSYLKLGFPTAKGNFSRERRYYADVAFNGSLWFGSGVTDDRISNYVNAINGYAYPPDKLRFNATGYWPRKLVPYQTTYSSNSVIQNYSWPFMRLTGLWLLYAECMNEVHGPSSDAYLWVNKVRARAGLKTIQDAWTSYSNNPGKYTTKEGFRQIIHQERRIELAFEGQSGWDLRRWKELQTVLSTPVQGWNIYQKTAENYYQLNLVFQPVFSLKDYFFPIKENDLIVNPNLVQNLYW
ncbi:RagB/SusD family nutrient uptake outer membrane protein [Filimonas effusa]|uniref:RagB/SusD family nutrient uptake outer membrane protein n=1 Tax=Filimonas effusa TaxID=2508721 RepID=A0A4Q1D9K9_9BACT|nr:RagB/SusD family nutrient uptake outer membrane protein [Filimonas effusa]RXK85528.1 RagB/SusD family nutrient uptake outer membrane protein [Filimonas effusa]